MARGTYRLADGRLEQFACGRTDQGWRYRSTRSDGALLDLTAAGPAGIARLTAEHGGWEVRAGTLGPDLVWRRGTQERTERAGGFTGTSPAYDVVLARLLALEPGQQRRVRLVELTDPVLATRVVEQSWQLLAVEDHGGLLVERFVVGDLGTGRSRRADLVGDLVVAGDGVDLVQLDTTASEFGD